MTRDKRQISRRKLPGNARQAKAAMRLQRAREQSRNPFSESFLSQIANFGNTVPISGEKVANNWQQSYFHFEAKQATLPCKNKLSARLK